MNIICKYLKCKFDPFDKLIINLKLNNFNKENLIPCKINCIRCKKEYIING